MPRIQKPHNWRNLKSAPKDGRHIMVVMIGRHPQTNVPFIPFCVRWRGGKWVSDLTENLSISDTTHMWMPLPKNPCQYEE